MAREKAALWTALEPTTPHLGRLAALQSDLIGLSDLLFTRAWCAGEKRRADFRPSHTQHDAITAKLLPWCNCVCVCTCVWCVCELTCACVACVCVKKSLFLAGRIPDLFIPYFVLSIGWILYNKYVILSIIRKKLRILHVR